MPRTKEVPAATLGESGKVRAKFGGRKKGTLNKFTSTLKEAILLAAEQAGAPDGLVGYLKKQAEETPQSFLPLLGKVLPLQIGSDPENPVRHSVEIHIVDHRPKS